MIELKPHYSLIDVFNTDLEIVSTKYNYSYTVPSNITFTRLKNHLVISINIRSELDDSEELKTTLLKNNFNIFGFISGRINNDYWNIICQYNYKSYSIYINNEFILKRDE